MFKSVIYILIALVVAIVLVFGFKQYFFPAPAPIVETPIEVPSEDKFTQIYNSGMSYREAGDYVSAADAFETAISVASTATDKAEAQRRAGIANFLTDDQQKQIEGINQLKASVATAPDEWRKAVAISDLASTICGSGCDAMIFAEVFKGEPYSQFYYPEDLTRSVTALYEWSMSVAPGPDAVVRASTWYADQLLTGDLTEAERTEYVTTLDGYMSEAARLTSFVRVGARSEISFYFWSGYAYGALATVDAAKYGPYFEGSYQKAIELGRNEPAGSNKNYAVLFAYYQYAVLLDYLYGEARSTDVEANLNALMTSVKADPKPANNQFLLMASNELNTEGSQHGFIGDSLSRLALKYPAFKSFLESYNLSLE